MAASNYKITLFYNQFTQGFTETWYYSGTLVPNYFASTALNALFNASMAFRHPNVALVAARYSVVGSPRQTFTQFFSGKYGNPGTIQSITPDPSSLDLLIKIYSVGGSFKHMYLRGLNQSDTYRNPNTGLSVPTANLQQAVTNYLSACYAQSWAIQQQQTVATDSGLYTANVLQVATNPAQEEQSLVTVSGTPVFAGAQPWYVRFARVPKNNLPGFPRICQVQGVVNGPPGVITIPYRFRAQASPWFPQNMAVVQQLYTYPLIYAPVQAQGVFQFLSFLERKTGKAFFVPRGRTRVAINRT